MTKVGLVLSQRSERHQRLAVLREFLDAALLAADPKQAVRRALHRQDHVLSIDVHSLDLRSFHRVLVVGAGKAAAAMAQEVEDILGPYVTAGVVAVKQGYVAPTRTVRAVEGGHPLPGEMLRKRGLLEAAPVAVLRHLRQGAAGKIAETPKPDRHRPHQYQRKRFDFRHGFLIGG